MHRVSHGDDLLDLLLDGIHWMTPRGQSCLKENDIISGSVISTKEYSLSRSLHRVNMSCRTSFFTAWRRLSEPCNAESTRLIVCYFLCVSVRVAVSVVNLFDLSWTFTVLFVQYLCGCVSRTVRPCGLCVIFVVL